MKIKQFFITILFCWTAIAVSAQDRTTDSLALVQFYHDMDGVNWIDQTGWLTAEPLDNWFGITMMEDRVYKLKLLNNNLSGSFSSAVYELTHLETLELLNDEITGSISDSLLLLQNLRILVLTNLEVGGELPSGMDQLFNLENLRISGNNFIGALPDISPLVELAHFHLNQFSGSVPDSWQNLGVITLNLSNNQFDGNFDALSTCLALKTITLFNNGWEQQPLPTWLDDLPDLRSFSCSNCNLVGEIPVLDFTDQPLYYSMRISNNQLSGDISYLFPAADSELSLTLHIENNLFEGTLPTHLIKRSGSFNASQNQFDSLTTFDFEFLGELNVRLNKFNFSKLMPAVHLIEDENTNLRYNDQLDLLDEQEIMITQVTELMLYAGDDLLGTTYQWYKNNAPIENMTNAILNLSIVDDTNDGVYYCQLNHPDFPELSLERQPITIQTDIIINTQDVHRQYLTVYPNPCREQLQIQSFNLNSESMSFNVINLYGQIVETGEMDNQLKLDVSSLTNGIYFIQLFDDNDRSHTIRFEKID